MNYSLLIHTTLFRGTNEAEAKEMLTCLGAFEKSYGKGAIILGAGDLTDNMGLVLAGSVNMEIDDLWENKTILGHAQVGQLFAETYACIPGEPLMVSVVAAEKCDVLFLNAAHLLTTCQNSCAHHNKLIRNLLQISAGKNLALSRRSLHTSFKSIRARLLSYLSEQVKQNGSYQFSIPFNRQQLADYLSVDRSALSNELSRMQRDGLLTFEKNYFSLVSETPRETSFDKAP